jgi:hypothetical protein
MFEVRGLTGRSRAMRANSFTANPAAEILRAASFSKEQRVGHVNGAAFEVACLSPLAFDLPW